MSSVALNSSALSEITIDESRLLKVTDQYLSLVNIIGGFKEKINPLNLYEFNATARSVLDSCLKKIVNCSVRAENRYDFISDLIKINQTTSRWNASPVDTITSVKTGEVVLRLIINMEKVGMFTAIVILRFNKDYKIFEINEVLSKVEGAYPFDEVS